MAYLPILTRAFAFDMVREFHSFAFVAQLDRVSASEAEGRAFESRRAQFYILTNRLAFQGKIRIYNFLTIVLFFCLGFDKRKSTFLV